MKTILIPTDFSGESDELIKYGLSFLQNREEDLKILLLNTFQVPFSNPKDMVVQHDELKKKSQEQLRKEVEGLKKAIDSHGKISLEGLSFMGSLENVIEHVAREENADLVILGDNERSQKKESLMKLIRRLDCPVLYLPPKPASAVS